MTINSGILNTLFERQNQILTLAQNIETLHRTSISSPDVNTLKNMKQTRDLILELLLTNERTVIHSPYYRPLERKVERNELLTLMEQQRSDVMGKIYELIKEVKEIHKSLTPSPTPS